MLMRSPQRWVRPKRLQPPGFVVPCQPTLAGKVPEGDGWIHVLKHDGFDGFRIFAFKPGDTRGPLKDAVAAAKQAISKAGPSTRNIPARCAAPGRTMQTASGENLTRDTLIRRRLWM